MITNVLGFLNHVKLPLVFCAGVVASEVVQWIHEHVHIRSCVLCGARICGRTCPRGDPPLGVAPCPSCGQTRWLFARRPVGPIECWGCRGEPDPGAPP